MLVCVGKLALIRLVLLQLHLWQSSCSTILAMTRDPDRQYPWRNIRRILTT